MEFCVCLCVLTLKVQQQLTPVPVQHVYANQVQYVEGEETNYTTSTMLVYIWVHYYLTHVQTEFFKPNKV